MTPPQAQTVSAERPRADATARSAATGAEGPFVINLCSSTTPMALSQPRDAALARFTFFMSRRLEDGRERFRLHMGYFETLAEAEELLGVVREVYPGAWAGEAPGKRLRARQAEPAAGVPPVQTPPVAVSQPAPSAPSAPAPVLSLVPDPEPRAVQPASAEPPVPANVPILKPAPTLASAAQPNQAAPGLRASGVMPARGGEPVAGAKPASATKSVGGTKPSTVTKPATVTKAATVTKPAAVARPATVARPASGAKPVTGAKPATAVTTNGATPAARTAVPAAALQLSNVREVLASLDESGATRQMPVLGSTSPPRGSVPPARSADPEPSLSDTQVLKLLESRRADGGRAEDDSSITLLKPDDTGTRQALKEAVASDAPVSFAVQLQWSVQPIDAAKVPPLAIFSAYTLYTVEGSREGRRWYGLRLGFFSDAISAKQVAHYVRSEFNSVAVVPVSPQERSRATDGSASAAAAKPAPQLALQSAPHPSLVSPTPPRSPLRDRLPEPTAEFKLFEEEPPPSAPEPKPAAKPPAAPAPKRSSKSPPGRVRAREKRSPQTLEETLEILGADELEIDRDRGDALNDTGVRHLTVQVRKNSPFTRLLDRLAERGRGK